MGSKKEREDPELRMQALDCQGVLVRKKKQFPVRRGEGDLLVGPERIKGMKILGR